MTNNSWNSQDPVQVAKGGTGIATTTAYAPIVGGTTATGAFQAASTGLSSSGYVLTSNGASAVPSFQALPSSGIVTINGNSGSVTGATITITTGSAGGTALFSGSGTTLTLVETDASINTGWGLNTLDSLTSGTDNSAFGKDALVQPGSYPMKRLAIIALVALSSCTYTISMVHTQGEASDVIDETSSASAKVDPVLNIPASVLP